MTDKELKWTGNKKKQRNIQKIFKEKKIDIVIQCNMRIANYLDVSLNLNNSNYKPYHKPYNEILYIHKDANQPLCLFKQIPTSIKKRFCTLSPRETKFIQSKEIYQKALEKSGYLKTLKYHPTNENISKKKQNRKQMLFGLTLNLVLLSKQKSEIIF